MSGQQTNKENRNENIMMEDWGDGKFADFQRNKQVTISLIEEKGLGNVPVFNRKFNWMESPDTKIKFKPTAINANEITLTANETKSLIKDDVLFNSATGRSFRVTESPTENSTTVKIIEITNDNTEVIPVDTAFLNKDFIKAYTSKAEGSKDRDGISYNPEDFHNVCHTFEDFSETAEETANEPWQGKEFTYREYNKVEMMDKHKSDMNACIWIGKYQNDGIRLATKGITNFTTIQKQIGDAFEADGKTLKFKIEDFDLFVEEKVRRYAKGRDFAVVCNNGFLTWLNAIVRTSTNLSFTADVTKDEFGYNIRRLVHNLIDAELFIDEDLNDLYPNQVFAGFMKLNKIQLAHLNGANTKIKLGCQNDYENVILDKIRTVGGGVKLIKPHWHTILQLNRRAV
jgi:hypothetical protein